MCDRRAALRRHAAAAAEQPTRKVMHLHFSNYLRCMGAACVLCQPLDVSQRSHGIYARNERRCHDTTLTEYSPKLGTPALSYLRAQ